MEMSANLRQLSAIMPKVSECRNGRGRCPFSDSEARLGSAGPGLPDVKMLPQTSHFLPSFREEEDVSAGKLPSTDSYLPTPGLRVL